MGIARKLVAVGLVLGTAMGVMQFAGGQVPVADKPVLQVCISPKFTPMRQPDIKGQRNYIMEVHVIGKGDASADGYFLVVTDRQDVGWVQSTGGFRTSDLRGDVKREFGLSNISTYPLEVVVVRTGGAGLGFSDFQDRARRGVYLTPEELDGRIVSKRDTCLLDLVDETPVFTDCTCK